MQQISGLSPIIDHYDALLLDLWGVIHDGTHLYPGVHQVLTTLHKQKKKIIFVSNAPRRAAKVRAVLATIGIEQALYDDVISSGEAGYRWLSDGKAPWGHRYYYIGPLKDADVMDGLSFQRTDDIEKADFLLNVGFGTDEQSSADWMPLFRQAKARDLPMLCLNPDMEVVKQTGEVFPCAGVLAEEYETLGGEVTWFGKPYAAVYEYCFDKLKLPKERILAVGDSIITDIKGGVENGIDTALVTGGILKTRTLPEIEALCERAAAQPNFVMPAFSW